jgi:hypothetical protein
MTGTLSGDDVSGWESHAAFASAQQPWAPLDLPFGGGPISRRPAQRFRRLAIWGHHRRTRGSIREPEQRRLIDVGRDRADPAPLRNRRPVRPHRGCVPSSQMSCQLAVSARPNAFAASRSRSGRKWLYTLSVVEASWCPRRPATVRTSWPPPIIWVAAKWRSA